MILIKSFVTFLTPNQSSPTSKQCLPGQVTDTVRQVLDEFLSDTMNDRSGENLLHRSWNDPAWTGLLNEHNVMDYFMERTNPFYDR